MSAQFGAPAGGPANKDWEMASSESLILHISNPDLRENALLELSKEIFQDLAAFVWNSFGTIAALIQEDPTTRRWLQQLLHNVGGGTRIAALQALVEPLII